MLDCERAIVPFRQTPRRDLNCVTVLPAIPRTFNSIREPPLFHLHPGGGGGGLSRPSARISTKSVCRESKYKEAIVEIR